jgi:hypothetical protein
MANEIKLTQVTTENSDIAFDTQPQFNQVFIDDFPKLLKTNYTIPTHTPKKLLDCIYPYFDGESEYSLYVYINKVWKRFIGGLTFASPLSESSGAITLETVGIDKGGTGLTSVGEPYTGLVSDGTYLSYQYVSLRDRTVRFTASNILRASANNEVAVSSTTAQLEKEIQVLCTGGGTVRVTYETKGGGTEAKYITASLRVNGVEKYSDNNTTTSWVTYTHDVSVNYGDLVQLYCLSSDGDTYYADSFRIYYNRSLVNDYKVIQD